jgi:MFS family permease
VFGRLSDRIGRVKIILAGCLVSAIAYIPLFHGLTHFANPALEEFQDRTTITVAGHDCAMHVFVFPGTTFSACDKAKDFLTKNGLSFESIDPVEGTDVVVKIDKVELRGWDDKAYPAALKAAGFPIAGADGSRINYPMVLLILVVLVAFVTMVYGPIAAYLVELFPAKIRYTSMSLPYHIGNGWFGGMLPLIATAMVAASGNIYRGLWYPIAIALLTFVVGLAFLREKPADFDIAA